jgi:phytoene dehydrogenase-like protein
MRKVVDSLFNLALDLGVRFEFNQSVENIAIKNGVATGVDTKIQQYQGSKVFCNMDVNMAYPKLLAEQKQPRLTLKQEKSTSALVFYWGMQITDSPLDVHNVIFSGDYKEEFACLEKGELSDDPTVYIYISSKVDGKDAPANHENWFVMINVPPDSGQDWTSLKEKARKNILKKLAHQLRDSLEDKILFEEILDPIKIERETSSFGGALYGNSSNNMFAAFLRHPHRNNQIKNLFFVGGSTHPGGGIPLCLLSAKIAVNGSKKE